MILGVGVGLGGRAVGRFGIGVEMGTDMGKGIDSGWICNWMGMNYGIGVGCSMCYSTDCCRRLRSILYIGYMFQECSSFIFVQELMISTTVCTFQDSLPNSAHPNILPFLPHSNSIPLLTILLNIIIQPQNYIHYIIHHIPYKNIKKIKYCHHEFLIHKFHHNIFPFLFFSSYICIYGLLLYYKILIK